MYLKRPAGGLAFCLFYLASCFTNKVSCSAREPGETGEAAAAEAGAPGHVAAGGPAPGAFASQNGGRGGGSAGQPR